VTPLGLNRYDRPSANKLGHQTHEGPPAMQKLEIMDSSNKVPFLSGVVRRQGGEDAPIEILEAGCGQRWLLKLDGKNFRLIGVDLDKDALEIRKNVRKDLDEAIHGDLRTISFGERRFDVVYSAFVLEHIEGAEPVLARMASWLKPGGIIIIEIPDPDSIKGRVTKITPHWFHVFYYKYVLGKKTAGLPGYGPYRTIYDPVVSRQGMADFCQRNGLQVESEYAFRTDGPKGKLMRALIGSITKLSSLLTLGTLSDRHADLLYVLRRRAA
jgi:SAM-dependent methyltransferase